MKKNILASILLLFATLLTAFCVAEISFPETFLTITDKDWFLEIFPNGWKYNIHIGVGAFILAAILIIPAWVLSKNFTIKALETLFRVGIGGFFIASSLFKIESPKEFAVLMAQYQFFPAFGLEFLNNIFALMYPQLEFWFGLALIFSPYTRESALVIFLMFISFIIALSWAIFHDLGITCGCFNIEGAQDKNETWTSLIRDLILLVPNFWLLCRKNKSLIRLWKE
ncbi:MAG: MauE/DoxX family redox-associated membrane protein [Fibrobacteraceae bacterium]|nr:MauE/DoxX family redox-associated membrane protein [Fibrobacteraceae bacterium]